MGSSKSVPGAEANVALSSDLIALETHEGNLGSHFLSMEIKPGRAREECPKFSLTTGLEVLYVPPSLRQFLTLVQ